MNRILYLGMPGSGKTTKLLQILEEELLMTKPHQIAFVSFTKKAIQEAQQRCLEKLGVHKNEMPFFKTLHALAFAAMGLREHDVINDDHLELLSKQLGIDLVSASNPFKPLALYNLSRAKGWTLFETWSKTFLIHSKPYKEIAHIVQAYERYKERNGIIDFTDMIEQYNKNGCAVPVKTAFVDEAQDLSNAQWKMIERAFCNVDNLIVAGDDDQCIYSWSGADRKQFLNFDGRKEILNVSYRCPQSVAKLGNSISKKISQRYAKELTGTHQQGSVTPIISLDECSKQLKNGEDWLLLVRNRVDIDWAKQRLMMQGVSFSVDNKPFCPAKHAIAIEGYRQVYSGMRVQGSVASHIADCANIDDVFFDSDSQYTAKDIFKDAELNQDFRTQLVGITPRRRNYYHDTLSNDQILTNPKIHVSTIHGAKGAECMNVILAVDQSVLTYRSAQVYQDNEHRVFYVGATRAKANLFLLAPGKKRHYQMPKN